jgi:hypothetical protein
LKLIPNSQKPNYILATSTTIF